MTKGGFAGGHATKLITPQVTQNDRLENEALHTGMQCRCGYWNLPRRRMCKRCGKRLKATKKMIERGIVPKGLIGRRRRVEPLP